MWGSQKSTTLSRQENAQLEKLLRPEGITAYDKMAEAGRPFFCAYVTDCWLLGRRRAKVVIDSVTDIARSEVAHEAYTTVYLTLARGRWVVDPRRVKVAVGE